MSLRKLIVKIRCKMSREYKIFCMQSFEQNELIKFLESNNGASVDDIKLAGLDMFNSINICLLKKLIQKKFNDKIITAGTILETSRQLR